MMQMRRQPTVEGYGKSTYSPSGGDCVETRESPDEVRVRDTKHRDQGHLSFTRDSWAQMIAIVRQ